MTLRSPIGRLWREPLVQFLALGARAGRMTLVSLTAAWLAGGAAVGL